MRTAVKATDRTGNRKREMMSRLRCCRGLIAVLLMLAASLCILVFYKYATMTQYGSRYYAPSTTCESDFQVIEKNLAFAYSAYIDDKRARDSVDIDGPVVRIFIYVDRAMKATDTWQCLFWYKDKVDPLRRPVKRIIDLNESVAPRFLSAMALCALPELTGRTPHNVSVVPKSKKYPTNYICIEDLRSRRRSRLLEDTNRYSDGNNKSSSKEGNVSTFTICTKAIIHDGRYNVHDVVNFIEVNRILGAEKFIFYADRKTADLLIKQCLGAYSERGIVEIHPFSYPVQLEDLVFQGQIITTTECMYRVMYRTKFIIDVDLDEFIVPRNESNWSQLLINIHKKTTNGERIAAYNFRSQFFPHQNEDDPYFANNTLVKLHRITSLLQTLREDHAFPAHNNRSKVMARPEKVLVWRRHLPLKENLINKEDVVCDVQPDDALVFRYRKRTITSSSSAKLIRDRRMHDFTPQLMENIHFALGRCLPPN